MNENFNEIQDHIDLIVTTAKLIGYEVKSSVQPEIKSYSIQNNKKSFSILHYRLSNRIRVIENRKITLYTAGSFSHSEKIKALKDILEQL